MGDEKPTVIRIEYEYSDGTIARATGADAATLAGKINSAFVMDYIHGGGYSGPYLKPVDRKTSEPPAAVEILYEYDGEWLIYVRREFGRVFYHHGVGDGIHAVCEISEGELADLKANRRDLRSLFDDRPSWTITERIWAADDECLPARGVKLWSEASTVQDPTTPSE